MIRAWTFAGQKVAVFGLGGSGNATALSLQAGGAEVWAWDDHAPARDAAIKAGVRVADLNTADWSAFHALVLAPGVPLTHPEPHWTVGRAKAAEVEIIGDIEIFCRERARHCPGSPFVAITGTNGKSTTTALLTHILATFGLDVQMGGNIGVPILALEPPARDRVHVIEVSSFQIDLTPSLAPTVGVLLNLTPDHIDRHGTFDLYAGIKERLVQKAEAACVGSDDPHTRDIAGRILPSDRLYAFTVDAAGASTARAYAMGTNLFVRDAPVGAEAGQEIATLAGNPTLRGAHNVQNALAALTVLRALQDRLNLAGSPLDVWRAAALPGALATYPGLPHRMEEVGRAGRVLFINDSKATNADSTEKALAAFPRDIFWIVGGVMKEGGIEPLAPYFSRIAKAYLVGKSSDAFAATLAGGHVPFERAGTVEAALTAAAADAGRCQGAEPVVLLSPACASYDQYKSFAHRGDEFRRLVKALPGVASRPTSLP